MTQESEEYITRMPKEVLAEMKRLAAVGSDEVKIDVLAQNPGEAYMNSFGLEELLQRDDEAAVKLTAQNGAYVNCYRQARKNCQNQSE